MIGRSKNFVGCIKDIKAYPKTEHAVVQLGPPIFDVHYAFCLYLAYLITTDVTINLDIMVLRLSYALYAEYLQLLIVANK